MQRKHAECFHSSCNVRRVCLARVKGGLSPPFILGLRGDVNYFKITQQRIVDGGAKVSSGACRDLTLAPMLPTCIIHAFIFLLMYKARVLSVTLVFYFSTDTAL